MVEFKYLSDKDYFALEGISNSQLSCIINGPEHYLLFKNKERERKDHNVFGSLFHCLLLEPDEFLSRYFIVNESIDIPDSKNQAGRAIYLANKQDMFTESGELTQGDLDTLHSQLEVKRKKQKFYDEIMKYADFIEALQMSKDKETISHSQLNIAKNCVESVRRNKKYDCFFSPDLPSHNEHCVLFIPEGFYIQCKGKIDRCIIDIKNKKLVLLDMKTTGKPLTYFQQSYRSFEYYRQLAFYLMGLLSWLGLRWLPNDWSIEVYILAVEKEEPYCSKFFPVSLRDLDLGKRRYEELLAKLQWHIENDIWIDKDVWEGDGLGQILEISAPSINNIEDFWQL
jgi:hypothetical protein